MTDLHDDLFGSDLEGVEPAKEAGDTIPRGKYHIRIDNGSGRTNDDGTGLRAHFQLRIKDGASHVGKVLFVDLPLTPSDLGKRPRTIEVIKANLKRLKDELNPSEATPRAGTKEAVSYWAAQFVGKEFIATVTEMEASPYVDRETGEEKMGKARNFVIWGSVRHPGTRDKDGKTAIEKAQAEWKEAATPATAKEGGNFFGKQAGT